MRAADVLERHLAAIDAGDAEIHAFNVVTADLAREQAAAVDEAVAAGRETGRLAGVPIALKDNMCTQGIPTTCSSKILDGWKPPYDATIVGRLRDAGAVLIGKTNLDEFAMGSSTENSAFGPTRNPRDTSRVPGGSSGGSAAAVAAGFAPVALGSDTGGSIRQPACAVRRGRCEADLRRGQPLRARRVRVEPRPDRPVRPHGRRRGARARGDLRARPDGLDVDRPGRRSTCRAASTGASRACGSDGSPTCRRARAPMCRPASTRPSTRSRRAGAEIVDVEVPAYAYGLTAYYLIAPAEASSNLARYDGVRFGLRVEAPDTNAMYMATRTAGFGDEVKRRIMLGTYALSAGYYDAYYGRALKVRRLIADDFAAAYEHVDVLLTPTSPTVAFPIGDKTADPLSMYLCDTYTIPSNLSGDPAMSVPFGTGEAACRSASRCSRRRWART